MMIGLNPGFSLHGELRELVDAGLTPYEALRSSTTNPFEYLGEADRAGTIEAGKRSDLLLLDANPLEDVSAASKIAGVLVRGHWLGREAIRNKMRAIAESFRTPGGGS
jgi:imidazolonepropionase-like amidohydrolase